MFAQFKLNDKSRLAIRKFDARSVFCTEESGCSCLPLFSEDDITKD
jgi:hypothetical protein